jgi:hypothetical protein
MKNSQFSGHSIICFSLLFVSALLTGCSDEADPSFLAKSYDKKVTVTAGMDDPTSEEIDDEGTDVDFPVPSEDGTETDGTADTKNPSSFEVSDGDFDDEDINVSPAEAALCAKHFNTSVQLSAPSTSTRRWRRLSSRATLPKNREMSRLPPYLRSKSQATAPAWTCQLTVPTAQP